MPVCAVCLYASLRVHYGVMKLGKTAKTVAVGMSLAAAVACGAETAGSPAPDPTTEAEANGSAETRPGYPPAVGSHNLLLGHITCGAVTVTQHGERTADVVVPLTPMPQMPIVEVLVTSSNRDVTQERSGDDLTVAGDTLRTTIDAGSIGRYAVARVTINFPAGTRGNYGAVDCDPVDIVRG
jgi:hypothetical protein